MTNLVGVLGCAVAILCLGTWLIGKLRASPGSDGARVSRRTQLTTARATAAAAALRVVETALRTPGEHCGEAGCHISDPSRLTRIYQYSLTGRLRDRLRSSQMRPYVCSGMRVRALALEAERTTIRQFSMIGAIDVAVERRLLLEISVLDALHRLRCACVRAKWWWRGGKAGPSKAR